MLKLGDLVIANDHDRPEALNICIVTYIDPEKCTLRYLGRENWDLEGILLHEPTLLENFGVGIETIDKGDFQFYLTKSFFPSTAQYRNGKPRRWQEKIPRHAPCLFNSLSYEIYKKYHGPHDPQV